MVEMSPASRPIWLRADPDQLDRFARELEDLIALLERIRAKAADAAVFQSPSLDPASIRVTEQLAGDALNEPDTPAGKISTAISDLTGQVRAARLAAREYRTTEQDAVERMRRVGEELT
jgi:hypothetical protein